MTENEPGKIHGREGVGMGRTAVIQLKNGPHSGPAR